MKSNWTHLEQFRLLKPPMDSKPGDRFGAFYIPTGGVNFIIVADDGTSEFGWEHVSMRAKAGKNERCPSWKEMCWLKDLFWEPEETVLQFHPPKSEHVNCHPYVLHLFRQVGVDAPRPPAILVGPNLPSSGRPG
jgi:hypothetical protein